MFLYLLKCALILHRKKKNSLPRVFSHNGRLLKEPVEIANAFLVLVYTQEGSLWSIVLRCLTVTL